MANFDGSYRREIWLFSETAQKTPFGGKCLIPYPMKMVSYDGSPDWLIEPVNHCGMFRAVSGDNAFIPINPAADGVVISKIEIMTLPPASGIQEFHWI